MAPRASVGGSTLKEYLAFNTLSRRELKCPLPVSRLLRRLKGQSYDQFDEIFWALNGKEELSWTKNNSNIQSCSNVLSTSTSKTTIFENVSGGKRRSISRRQAKKEEFTVRAFSGDELSHLAKRGF